MLARQIKDLAIAREALSRFPGNELLSGQLESLMLDLATNLQKEIHPLHTMKTKQDADEIPF